MFKRDGKFNDSLYKELLKRNGMDPKSFEKTEKVALVNAKMMNLIRDTGAFLNEDDIWASYVKERGKINIGYAEFDPSSFRSKVTVSDQEVLNVYEKEKGTHKGENVYHLKYLVIDEKSQMKDDAAYMELLKAKDMEAFGKEKGLPVIDLGQMKEGEFLRRFKDLKAGDWLRGLRKGDISLPVRSDSKSYIFQLVAMEEGKPIDKDTVLKEIKERIMGEKAKALAKTVAEQAISKKEFDSKKDTGFIPRTSMNLPKLGPIPKEDTGVLSLTKNNPVYQKPVEIGGSYYAFYFKDEQLPGKGEWEKDKEGYKRYILAKNRDDFFKSFMQTLRQKEKVRIDWKDI
jgi:hypothetical protein